MIDWKDYKDNLTKASKEAMSRAIGALEPNDKICSMFFYISEHYYHGKLEILINIYSQNKKKKIILKETNKALKNSNLKELEEYINKWCRLELYYMELGEGGQEIIDFQYPFDFDFIKDNNELCKELFYNQIKASIEVQLELSKDETMSNENISDCFEFCYSIGQNDISISTVKFK